jgi:8-oxo-dGTP pyrophosphatase MutT (NUDIX family)
MKRTLIASGPVIVEDDKVLLDKHGDDIFWKFCGGKVEDFDYTLIENAQRKAWEEMGIKIEVLDYKPFIMHTSKEIAPEGKIDVILVHYLAERFGEVCPGKNIKKWEWISILELDELNKKGELAPNIIPTLKHFNII